MDNPVLDATKHLRLDPNFKAKWINALRSGVYLQSQGNLRTQKGFCCLGVACDVFDPDRWLPDTGAICPTSFTWGEGRDAFGLPDNVCRMINISEHTINELIEQNDRCDPVSFSDIARWIEENL